MKPRFFSFTVSIAWPVRGALLGQLTNIHVTSPTIAHGQARPLYEGKTVRVIVGPSGGYDYWTRLLARHMGKCIAGNPSFVVAREIGEVMGACAAGSVAI